MRRARLTVLALIAALVTAACAAPSGGGDSRGASATPAGPKRIVIVIRGEPTSLSRDIAGLSQTGSVTGADEVSMLVSVSLADIVGGTSIAGLILGEVAPSTENGLWKVFPDGQMETTWKVRPGATWHDGAPVTAEDFVFATQIGQNPEVATVRHAAFRSLAGAEAPDASTIVLRWTRPYIEADSWFGALEPQPRHLLAKAMDEDPGSFAQHPLFKTEFVGSGPFKLKEWVPGSHLKVAAYDGYFLGRPKLDEIEVRFILDPNVILGNLLAGAVDVSFGRGVSLEQGFQVRDQWRDGRVEFESSYSWIVLYPQFLTPNPAVIANLQFRRALLHILDRQELADTLYQGMVEVPHSIIGPGHQIYQDVQPVVMHYAFDPRRGAQMIEGLGYAQRADGFYYDATGTKLELPLRTTGGDAMQGGLMFATADRWKRAGVDTDPDVLPLQASQDREFRANLPGFQVVTANTEFRVANLGRYTSTEASLPENRYAGSNRGRYMNAEMDGLIARYAVAIPQAERLELARSIVRLLSEDLPDMPLAYNKRPTFIAKRLVNVSADMLTRNAFQWDMNR
jgi:peptide/nickel transport system substrate-binding protein